MSWSLSRGICGPFFVQRSGQVLTMLTTPTPALYMESFGDAAKGKVEAAEHAAEKKKKKEKEGKKKEKKMSNEATPSSSDSNREPASPAQ